MYKNIYNYPLENSTMLFKVGLLVAQSISLVH